VTRIPKHCVRLVVMFFLSAGSAAAVPIPAFDLRSLVNQSDLIVFGSIAIDAASSATSVTTPAGNVVPARGVTARVSAEMVLKGTLDNQNVNVEMVLPSVSIPYHTVPTGSNRLFLLQHRNGTITFTSPYYPSLPAAIGQISSAVQEPFDRVSDALGGVITAVTASADEKREAIRDLWGFNNRRVADALAGALGSSDPSIQLAAAAALLDIDDVRGLSIAEDALVRPFVGSQNLIIGLNVAIRDGLSDASAVPALLKLLTQGGTETRAAAATALGRTRSTVAIPSLVAALDDADKGVRYSAVVAVATIVDAPEWRPSPIAFDHGEQPYLQHWKQWSLK
jgi:hypothetical protein